MEETKNPATKKKVRVVKRIVKKKVIKKVPKRMLGVSDCKYLDKGQSFNGGMDVLDDGFKEVGNVMGLVGSGLLGDPIRNESRNSGKNHVDGDQDRLELMDGEKGQIELKDNDHLGDPIRDELRDSDTKQDDGDRIRGELLDDGQEGIELRDNEKGQIKLKVDGQERVDDRMELKDDIVGKESRDGDKKHVELQDDDQDRTKLMDDEKGQTELKDNDQERVELQDGDEVGMELKDDGQEGIELRDGDEVEMKFKDDGQEGIELRDGDEVGMEFKEGGENGEHDIIDTMDVEGDGSEEVVKEVTVESETGGLKSKSESVSQEVVSESEVASGKTVAARLYMKQMRKIFIHGLGQETKEEDIRKVFEEVGEVVEVKIITNFRSGRSRGFGFIRFASAEHANLALTKYQNIEICGRPCHTTAIEGIDTILLNNINKKWNKENVVELLQKIGIMKIDEVLVMPDPDQTDLNCGFAFLEFETKRDAQMAYDKLQNKDVFGKHSNIKVSWASSVVDPVEEEIHNNKSVYAGNLPLSWDEKEVHDHFKMFGEIESIALAKNLWKAKRNDFAFINYKTSESALSCIEALTSKKSNSNNGPKLKVYFAKSIPKVKPIKHISDSVVTEVSQTYQKANRSSQSQNQYQNAYQSQNQSQNAYQSRQFEHSFLGVYKPPQKFNNMIGKHEDSRKDSGSSTTAELVQLLREQASWKQAGTTSTAGYGTTSTAGTSTVYHQPSFGEKQPFTELGSKSLYHHNPHAYHRPHLQVPNVTHPRPTENMTSYSRYDQQRAHYMPGSSNVVKPDPRYLQLRDQTTYPGSSTIYRQRR